MNNKRNTVRLLLVVIAVIVLGAIVLILARKPTGRELVGIIEPLQHIAITDVTNGIRDGLGEYRNRVEVLVENANRDNSQLAQIIAKYKDRGVSVYVPIFTNTAQTVKSMVGDKPIVFAAVTDPVAAGLLKDVNKPESNITGVSDLWPIDSNLRVIRRILPQAKIIGVVYDPGDPSSAATMPILKEECRRQGLGLELRPVISVSEILQSLSSLKGNVDLLFTANDVTVTASLPALVTFSIQNKIPLFAGDYSSVKRGAIAAVGQNYYNVGVDAGRLVAAIIEGKQPRELPVVYTTGGDIYLNSAAAEKMGVALPDDVRNEAKEVYETISEE